MHLTFTLPDGTTYQAGPFDEAAVIGSSAEESALALPCESLAAQHAIVEPTAGEGGWQIRDLTSGDGLSDGAVSAGAFLLADGATVFLGDVRLDVALAAPGAAPRLITGTPARSAAGAAGASAHVQRLRAAQKRREMTGTAVLFLFLGVLAFAAGFAVRFLQ